MSAAGYDTIVVGGGAAGCALAARLTDSGDRRVLLVEAGPDDDVLARAMQRPGRVPPGADWRLTARIPRWGTEFPLPRIRAVGGTSLLQGGVALRGLAADYDRWARRAGADRWSHRRLLPVMGRVEGDQDSGGTGALGIRRGRSEERQPLHTAFLDGCAELGVPFCPDLNRQRGSGVGLVPQARTGTVKGTARHAYLDPARARPVLTVLQASRVTRLLLSGGRVQGVEAVTAGDGPVRYRAPQVVLAAGAVGSALVLLRSGIGDPRALGAAGVPVRVPLPGVGSRLRDHPAVWTAFGLERGHGGPDDPLWFQVMLRHLADGTDGLPDFALEAYHDFRLLPAATALRRAVLTASLLAPRGTGRIALDPTGPPGTPVVEFDYTGEDLADLQEAVGFGHRLLRTGALQRLGPHAPRLVSVTGHGGRCSARLPRALPVASAGGPYRVAAEDLARSAVTAHHLHGGCPMGPDPDGGDVVDDRCRVHGVEGLHVGDTSVAPTPVRANTHLLALVVAERVAELLGRDQRHRRPEAPMTRGAHDEGHP